MPMPMRVLTMNARATKTGRKDARASRVSAAGRRERTADGLAGGHGAHGGGETRHEGGAGDGGHGANRREGARNTVCRDILVHVRGASHATPAHSNSRRGVLSLGENMWYRYVHSVSRKMKRLFRADDGGRQTGLHRRRALPRLLPEPLRRARREHALRGHDQQHVFGRLGHSLA